MPRYLSQWLRTKYMRSSDKYSPISLPWRACKAGEIVYKHLMCNAEMKKLTPMCYSSQMFNMDPGDMPEDRQADFPSDESMKYFVAIALPKPHYYEGVWIGDDETMQLGKTDTRRFNQLLLDEFWEDYDKFWEDYQKMWAIKHPGLHCPHYDCMLDFMEFWQVDLNNEEALYRAVMRRNAVERNKKKK